MTLQVLVTPYHQYFPIGKTGSTSVIAALYGLEGTPVEIHRQKRDLDVARPYDPDGLPAFAVVRHPWERFKSVYRDKILNSGPGNRGLLRENGYEKDMSFEDFCANFIETGGWEHLTDKHLLPQVHALPANPLVNVDLMCHDFLSQEWEIRGFDKFYRPLPRLNTTRKSGTRRVPRIERERVLEFYEADVNLWRDVTMTFWRKL